MLDALVETYKCDAPQKIRVLRACDLCAGSACVSLVLKSKALLLFDY